jgi:phosphoribosylformylglycinamidine synthase
LRGFFAAVQQLNRENLALAYHDRSDGGLAATVCEMAFASHCGLELDLAVQQAELPAAFFAEEPGAVVQVRVCDLPRVREVLSMHGVSGMARAIGAG